MAQPFLTRPHGDTLLKVTHCLGDSLLPLHVIWLPRDASMSLCVRPFCFLYSWCVDFLGPDSHGNTALFRVCQLWGKVGNLQAHLSQQLHKTRVFTPVSPVWAPHWSHCPSAADTQEQNLAFKLNCPVLTWPCLATSSHGNHKTYVGTSTSPNCPVVPVWCLWCGNPLLLGSVMNKLSS